MVEYIKRDIYGETMKVGDRIRFYKPRFKYSFYGTIIGKHEEFFEIEVTNSSDPMKVGEILMFKNNGKLSKYIEVVE